MDYEESSEDEIERDVARDDLDITDDNELEDIHIKIDSLKEKGRSNSDSLKVRRAIEDHLEKIRQRKELDYLFDDDFVDEGGE